MANRVSVFCCSKKYYPFIMKVNSGADSQITIPTYLGGYNYDLRVQGGQSWYGLTGNHTINFPSANTDYFIEISGEFPHFHQHGVPLEKPKLLDIKQWGDVEWRRFDRSFYLCQNLEVSATDYPNVSYVESFLTAFRGNTSMTYLDMRSWDFSSAVNFDVIFGETISLVVDITGVSLPNLENLNQLARDNGATVLGLQDLHVPKLKTARQMLWSNPKYSTANGNENIKLHTTSDLNDIYGIVFNSSNLKSLEITDCSGVTNTTLAVTSTPSLGRLILTGLPASIDISTSGITGTAIDNLFTSLGTANPSATITLTTAQNTSGIDTTIATLKGWTIVIV